MVHLSIHLVDEANIAGPVQYRWMYLIERYIRSLKSYVRNKACPKGCIVKAYISQECVHFCPRYLDGFETRLNRYGRNCEGDLQQFNKSKFKIFLQVGNHYKQKKKKKIHVGLNVVEQEKERNYVLQNCDEVSPFIE